MREEVVPHERVVALRMVFREVDILVHVERDDILERELALAAFLNEPLIQPEGRRACGTSQFERALGGGSSLDNTLCDIVCRPSRHLVIVRFYDYSHTVLVFRLLKKMMMCKLARGVQSAKLTIFPFSCKNYIIFLNQDAFLSACQGRKRGYWRKHIMIWQNSVRDSFKNTLTLQPKRKTTA